MATVHKILNSILLLVLSRITYPNASIVTVSAWVNLYSRGAGQTHLNITQTGVFQDRCVPILLQAASSLCLASLIFHFEEGSGPFCL